MHKILIIDDEKTILDNLKFILELENFKVTAASSGKEGIELFRSEGDFDCVVSDMRMPGMTGIDVTRAIKEIDPDMGVIILTGHGDMDNAVFAMKQGAFDYLNKPVYSDKLLVSIENAIKELHLIRENRKLNEDLIRKNLYFQHINDSAQQILLHMAPKDSPQFEKLSTSAIYRSCDNVGGDMYDIFQLGNKIIFYIFDVCGHGILSAVMTMILKTSFQNTKLLYEHAGILPDIDKVFKSINLELIMNTSSNIYVTIFAGIIDLHTNEITYISAGHIDQYLQTPEGIVPLSSTSTVLGVFEEATFEPQRVSYRAGDRLFLFTDGLTEIWKKEVIVANEHMQSLIVENGHQSIESAVHAIYDEMISLYGEDSPDDDITIVGMEFRS
ncbi:MAG: SpoIIE family protein phosphatase [Clostridia bacterium]|nr:SpoIIE family protein phosphatase [Clostridia bacterium]